MTRLLCATAVVVGLAVAFLGFAQWASPAARDVGVVPAGAPSLAGPPASAAAATVAASRPVGPPVRLRLRSLRVDAPVLPVDAPGRDLQVPDDPSSVGWWRGGASPGDTAGTVVLAGHVDSATYGPGALFPLDQVRPGDLVGVSTTSSELTYVIRALRHYSKAHLPSDAFAGRSGGPGLLIVTCGGPFDRGRGSYLENVVVYATPT